SQAARDGRRDDSPGSWSHAHARHADQGGRRAGARGGAAAGARRAHGPDPPRPAEILGREDRRAEEVGGRGVIIAVIGGSNGGFATAADLALAGHQVRLWTRAAAGLGALQDDPTITLTAAGRAGSGAL